MSEGQVARFRIKNAASQLPGDPEALFRDLRGRALEVKHLWAHQADILRTYRERYSTSNDVALQLPTGSGKTLVGLLIAEWRRLTEGERALYVCPTRQLAYQVGEQAQRYGLRVRVLVGRQADYPQAEYGDYVTGQAVAATTYSAVFNSNPRLDDAQTLVLDDAHAAENYVADAWTVRIARSNPLYEDLLSLLALGLGPGTAARCRGADYCDVVDKVPIPRFMPLEDALTSLLNVRRDNLGSGWFPWLMLRDRLTACNAFVSWSEIIIRPLFAPTETHAAFHSATQRIYMSATLGESGELERLFGVRHIDRIPLPGGLDRQAVGRRLVLFPDRALSQQDALETALVAIGGQSRSLVLCPATRLCEDFVGALRRSLPGHDILRADDVEQSMTRFTDSDHACLVLANRYDGLDLADEACRLEVIDGLPSATNLQERFLWSRLNATSLLKERVRTRLAQALGRCTRNATDYAAVVILGREVFDFCARRENLRGMHPELLAELDFGMEQSADRQHPQEYLELLDAFWEQGADWDVANDAILAMRADVQAAPLPEEETLATTCRDEVDYLYHLWGGDWDRALECARRVADRLGGDNLRGYRGLWYYLAGSTAWLLAREDGEDSPQRRVALDLFRRATEAAGTAPWLARLVRHIGLPEQGTGVDEALSQVVDRLVDRLCALGLVGERFEQAMVALSDATDQDSPDAFEHALAELGGYLGFQADRPEGTATPDAVWELEDQYIIAFEAKSDATPGRISVSDLRQAGGHYNWLRANRSCGSAQPLVVLITPHARLDPAATPHSANLYHVSVGDLRARVGALAACLRSARSHACDRDTLAGALSAGLSEAGFSPMDVVEWLTQTAVADFDL